MDNVYMLLSEIRKRPQMYLGKLSLDMLHAFLDGYMFRDKTTNCCLNGFNEYVSMHYHIDTSHNWSQIIQFFHNDEGEAFRVFYKLLDMFLESKNADKNAKVECISYDEFIELINKPREEYYTERRRFFSYVIEMVNEVKPKIVLELGPAQFTLI